MPPLPQLVVALLLGGLVASAPTRAMVQEDERATTPPGREGPLSNDCFLPSSPVAARELLAGDELLARARAAAELGQAAEARRLSGNAFERWHEAASEAGPGESVFLESRPVHIRRLTEGLGPALHRRLEGLAPDELRAWTARFSDSAEAAVEAVLEGGAGEAELLAVTHRYPATPGAARAALVAGDLALESGRIEAARAHLLRGSRQARLAGAGELQRALRERRETLTPPEDPAPEAWQRASRITLADSLVLGRDQGLRSLRLHGPGIGVRPGLAFQDERTAIIQTTERIHVLRIDEESQLERERIFEPEKLLGGFSPWLDERLVPPDPPGWALSPAVAGSTLAFVHGRTLGDGDRNALLCVELPPSGEVERRDIDSGPRLPELRWAAVGDLLVDASGETLPIEPLGELPRLEYQPGPCIDGERVFVAARAVEGDVRAWLLCFDRSSGTLLWHRLLVKGADLTPDAGRLGTGGGLYGGASQDLLLLPSGPNREAQVFFGTHLGAGALVAALDGSPLWTVRNRRRDPRLRGWSGARALLGGDGSILWAPADSDRLYTLAPGPLRAVPRLAEGGDEGAADTDALFLAPARPQGEAVTLLGGDREESLVLGRARSEKTVSSRRPGRDRVDGLYLAQEETFSGEGLASPLRLYFATTRGLYLFDRARELYLLAYQGIPHTGETPAGGDVYARGGTVLVLGRRAVWAFRTDE